METFLLTLLALTSPALAVAADTDSTSIYVDRDVIVTASRYDRSNRLSVTNITAEDLALREPDLELPLLLESVPGVFAYSDAGSGLGYTYLKVRGFDQRRVGVLLNGIPLNDPEDHQVWWVDLPDLAASVQDIQLQRGVTNSIGGMTAIGGTANIITTQLASEARGRISVNAGSYGFARQMVFYETGDLRGGLASALRLSRQESTGFRDRSEYEGWGLSWSAHRKTRNSITRVNIHTGRELTHHAWDAVPESVLRRDRTANAETYDNAVDDFRQPHYNLHHTISLGENLALTNRIYYIRGEGFYENYRQDETAADYSLDRFLGLAADAEVDLIRRKWVRKDHVGWVPSLSWNQGRGRLLVGGDWYHFHSRHWGDILWVEGFAPEDFTEQVKYHQYTGDKDAFSLYANQRWQVSDAVQLTADLHFQHKQYRFRQQEMGNFTGDMLNGYTVEWDFFNPKGAINFEVPGRVIGGTLRAYGSVGVNHREPTDNELFDTWQGGDDLGAKPLFRRSREVRDGSDQVAYVEWFGPYVRAEKVIDYELGVGWGGSWLSLTLGGYWMDFTDEIVPYGGVNDDGSSIRGNAGKTRHRGLESSLRARVGRIHTVSVASSRSWDEYDEFIFHDYDGTSYDFAGNPIALFPQHLLAATWETQWHPALRSRVRLRNTGRQYLDNSGDAQRTIDPWTTVDLSLWCELGGLGLRALSGATAFAHVRNVTATEYETWGYWAGENYLTPAAGRSVSAGLDYGF